MPKVVILSAKQTYSATNVRNIWTPSTGSYNGFYRRNLSCMKMQEADGCAAPMSAEERHNLYTSMAHEAFDEEEGK